MFKYFKDERINGYHVDKDGKGVVTIHYFENPFDRKRLYYVDDKKSRDRKIFKYLKEAKQFVEENF